MRRLNKEEIIQKSKLKHENFYDYSKSEYVGYDVPMEIVCPIHGSFFQKPHFHLSGKGCKECGIVKFSKSHLHTHETFIKKANEKHQNKYNYPEKYLHSKKSIKINCPDHGDFYTTPKYHLDGRGCTKCTSRYKGTIKSKQQFIDLANLIHDSKFDYSKIDVSYITRKTIIICPYHGEFSQKPNSHLKGIGCPSCNESKSEIEIRKILKSENIKFITQKKFENCKNINYLYFDFFLPEHNICIEYDGEQHYKPNKHFGGIESLNKIKKNDNIKNDYCKNNNIELIRIKYDEDIKSKMYSILEKLNTKKLF